MTRVLFSLGRATMAVEVADQRTFLESIQIHHWKSLEYVGLRMRYIQLGDVCAWLLLTLPYIVWPNSAVY